MTRRLATPAKRRPVASGRASSARTSTLDDPRASKRRANSNRPTSSARETIRGKSSTSNSTSRADTGTAQQVAKPAPKLATLAPKLAPHPAPSAASKPGLRSRRPANAAERTTSDEAVARATNKTWSEWFEILDAAHAQQMDHSAIAAIAATHGAGPWWQQMVAVEYEQARGLRKKHETPSGFQISRSVTLPLSVSRVYAAWSDPKLRARWLTETIVVRKATALKSMRITWPDGTHVETYFWPRSPKKCQVTVQHNKLPDERAAARMKLHWAKALERFAAALH